MRAGRILDTVASKSLNPCYSGICSVRNNLQMIAWRIFQVLILVIVEYAL